MVLVLRIMQCLGNSMRLIKLLSILLVFTLVNRNVNAETLYVIGHHGSFKMKQTNKHFADYYLLKIKNNAAGQMIIPINLPLNYHLRAQFSTVVFHRSPEALSEYWDRMSFRGVRPPVVQSSEQAVMLFVSRVKGAIGYVSKKPPQGSKIDILEEIPL